MKGYIHSFESLAAVDGPGLRCAVFLSGCPLRCVYCHNPDTWNMHAGTETEADVILQKILRFRPYFKENGGVTFSGGEPLLQAAFLKELTAALHNRQIPYVIDTSGSVALTEDVKEILLHAQTVLLDLKFWDSESYRQYTQSDGSLPWKTLQFLELIQKPTWLRTVIVPDLNDTKEKLALYLEKLLPFTCIEKYELLPFHTMGFYKYRELGIRNPLQACPAADPQLVKELQTYVNDSLLQRSK